MRCRPSYSPLSRFSALCATALVSSSMLADVSSSVEACCSVRDDKSILPLAISDAPTSIDSVAALIDHHRLNLIDKVIEGLRSLRHLVLTSDVNPTAQIATHRLRFRSSHHAHVAALAEDDQPALLSPATIPPKPATKPRRRQQQLVECLERLGFIDHEPKVYFRARNF